ncbi:hypothetical protein Poli38472_014669 [Pythium oligandrum]|uniref:Uncharacterized protein n=1 Tax=Pythium oligandrum TaxID=41045 RepID=A0A8K1CJ27_PYTOL|nr:hypothetical protein Poli38472_014669 [Pythium oligandrum]|eukprot:TMW63964.1 hypothetical protein Poli38472_014669 [Pythium oligandrum]
MCYGTSITIIVLFVVFPIAYFRWGRLLVLTLCALTTAMVMACPVDTEVQARLYAMEAADTRVVAFNQAYCVATQQTLCWNAIPELTSHQLVIDWSKGMCMKFESTPNQSIVEKALDTPQLKQSLKELCASMRWHFDGTDEGVSAFKTIQETHVELCDPVALVGSIKWCGLSNNASNLTTSPFNCFRQLSLRKTYKLWINALIVYRAFLIVFIALGLHVWLVTWALVS